MPFIWNDRSYWKRYKASLKIAFKVFLPMLIMSLLLWTLFLNRSIELTHLLLVSVLSAGIPFTLIGMFKQYPNPGIPDTYPQWGKNLMYIGQLLAGCFGLYIVLTKVIFI